jgi:hypothetical protein
MKGESASEEFLEKDVRTKNENSGVGEPRAVGSYEIRQIEENY